MKKEWIVYKILLFYNNRQNTAINKRRKEDLENFLFFATSQKNYFGAKFSVWDFLV